MKGKLPALFFAAVLIVLVLVFILGNLPRQIAAAPGSELEADFLNVGQGDAIFFKSGNHTMLVDCGEEGKGAYVSNYLMDRGVYRLDYLVITHTDSDHMGGCPEVLRNVLVKNVIMDGQKRITASYIETMALAANSTLTIAKKYDEYYLGVVRMRVLHANTGSSESNQNSIVFMLYDGNFTLLMGADCDLGCETDLLKENIDADVLKVAHHGSKYGSSAEFLQEVSPQLAVIEVGMNSYGHPANETLERLRDAGAEILRTDLNGTVVLETNGTGYALN
ncbi:MAG: ComEC/Rec2 family competence protein [Candidatus ainarchaeum sp.]|nr:ComEC/Rec2 family competence protein [Candidatus ainarchaeum sp.]